MHQDEIVTLLESMKTIVFSAFTPITTIFNRTLLIININV